MKKTILAISIFLLGWAAPLPAEIITYQGRLKESNLPVNANRAFTFELCSLEAGGSCLSSPSGAQSFTVQNGLFKSTFTLPAVDLSAGEWYLQVTVGASVLTPRERLTAVPYSVYASSSAYSSQSVQKTGDTMSGQLTISGSTLTVTGNEFSVGGSTFVVKNGYVGIGTASPSNPLQVSAQGQYVFVGSAVGTFATINLVPSGGGTARLNNNSGTNAKVALSIGHVDHLVVDQSANVGISSANPSYRLVVSSGAGEAGNMVVISTGDSNVIRMTGAGQVYANSFYGDGSGLTGVAAATGVDSTKVAKAGDTMSGQLTLAASTLTVTGGKLLVSGLGTEMELLSDVGGGHVNTLTGQALYLETGGTNRLMIDNLGKVAINKTPPNYLFDVGGAANFDGQTIVGGTLTVAGAAFSVGGSTLVVAGGKVGVGAETPQTKLHISSGTMLIDGNVGGAMLQVKTPNSGGYDRISIMGPDNTSLQAYEIGQPVRSWLIGQNLGNFGDGRLQIYDDTASKYRAVFLGSGDIGLGGTDAQTSPAITIQGTGLVGLGATSPGAALDLRTPAVTDMAQLWRNSAGTVVSSVSAAGVMQAIQFVGDGSGLTNVAATTGVDASKVSKAGDTMIGQLTLAGSTLTVTGGAVSVSALGTEMELLTNVGGGHVNTKTSQPLYLGTGGTDRFMIDGLGKIAINKTPPNYLLDVGGEANFDAQVIVGGTLTVAGSAFSVGGSTLAVNNGMVGVGAATPAYSLDVNGTMRSATAAGGNGRLILGDGDIAHGMTSLAPTTDTFGMLTANSPTGGLHLAGYSSLGTASGLYFSGVIGNSDPDDAVPAVVISGAKQNGGGAQPLGVSETLLAVNNGGGAALVTALGNGHVGLSTGVPQARLDVLASASDPATMAQIWRNSAGTVVSSVSATGVMMGSKFVGDGSGLTNVAAATGVDASKVAKAGDTMSGQLTLAGSSLTVTGSGLTVGATPTNRVLVEYSGGIGHVSVLGGALALNNSGQNVGINTTLPAYNLDVNGAIRAQSQLIAAGTATVQGDAFSVGGSTLVVAGGRVGIGVPAPTVALDVSGGVSATTLFASNSVSAASILKVNGGGVVALETVTGNSNISATAAGAKNMVFTTDAVERMRIDSTGKVGVGTAAPAAPLDVFGRVQISTRTGGNDSVDGLLSQGANGMMFQSAGTTFMRVANGGNYVGIGSAVNSNTNSPRLQVQGSMSVGSGIASSQPPANSLVVEGKVGIGTATPSGLLEVRDIPAANGYLLVLATGTGGSFFSVSTSGIVGVGYGNPSTNTVLHAQAVATNLTAGEDVAAGLVGSARAVGTGPEDVAVGGDFRAEADGNQSLAFLAGLHANVERTSGGTGVVGSAVGLYIDVPRNGASPGGFTNTYGVYIDSQTSGSQTNAPYAFYSVDKNARAYFAGKVGMGTASPRYALEISSAAGSSDQILVVSTGTDMVFGVKGNGEVYGAKFIGDGSSLTNLAALDASKLPLAGGIMAGQLTNTSSVTITGNGGGAYGLQVSSNVSLAGSLYTANGNIGIGTATPVTRLELYNSAVNEDTTIRVSNQAGVGYAAALRLANAAGIDWGINAGGSGRGDYLNSALAIFENTPGHTGARLIIKQEGNVGIGTTGPSYRLHVSSGAGEAGTVMAVSTGATNLFWVAGDGAHALKYYGDGSGLTGVIDNSRLPLTGGMLTGPFTVTGASITINADVDGNLMRLNSNDVAGGYGAMGFYKTTTTLMGTFGFGDPGGIFTNSIPGAMSLSGNNGLHLGVGGTARLTIATDNKVGIGNTAPVYALDISTANTIDGYVFRAGDNGIIISTGGAVQTTGVGNGAVGGNARGNGATDLQTARIAATQVASGLYAAITGGRENTASGAYSVASGNSNTALGDFSAVVGGSSNTVTAQLGFVGGGDDNHVYGDRGVVVGGARNIAGVTGTKFYASVVGGQDNEAKGEGAFVGGGTSNEAFGNYAVVPGGNSNAAGGGNSFAAGYASTAAASGAFAWNDSNGDSLVNNAANQVQFKASGGFWVSTGTIHSTPGLFVSAGNWVGIGTDAPAKTLHIKNQGNVPDIRLERGLGGETWDIGGNSGIYFNIASGGTNRLTISDTGFVGIGITPGASPSRLQVAGDVGLGDGTVLGNAPVVIWLTAASAVAAGDLVAITGNNLFNTTTTPADPAVIGVALNATTAATVGKVAVGGVVLVNCAGPIAGQHAITSGTAGQASGVNFPTSGTSAGVFLTNCGVPSAGKALLLLK